MGSMKRRTRLLVVGATIIVVGGLAGTGIAVAAAGDDPPITGSDLDQASAAALAHTGSGRVTETETGGDQAYEVEVTLEDGTQVEVEMDQDFKVLSSDRDGETGDD
jgi:hypothetical protein